MKRNTRLLFSNVAIGCTDDEFKRWIETRGYSVQSVRLIRDHVSGTSPSFGYAQLTDPERLDEAASALNGQLLLGRSICVNRVVPLQVVTEGPRTMRASA